MSTTFAPKNDLHETVRAFLKTGARNAVAAVASQFEAEFVALSGDGVALAVAFVKSKRILTPDAVVDEKKAAQEEFEREARQQAIRGDLQRRNPNLKVEF